MRLLLCVPVYMQVGVPIRALAIDARHTCWAGDEAGFTYMLQADRNLPSLLLRKVEVPPASAQLWQATATRAGPTAAALAAAANQSPRGAPILALFSRGPVVLSSGGEDRNHITLWNSHNCEAIGRSATNTYGPAHSFAAVSWQEAAQQPADAAAAAGGYDPRGTASDLSGWRLLSGHETGQLLMWQVQSLSARGGAHPLQLLSIILEPKQLR